MKNPILYSENNCAYCNNSSFIMGYKIILPEIFSLSEPAIDETLTIWQSVIKRLPEGCFIHRLDAYIEQEFDTTVLPDRTYFQEGYKEHFTSRKQLQHHSFVFFGVTELQTLSNLLTNPFAKQDVKASFSEQNWLNITFKQTVESEVSYVNRSASFKLVSLSDTEMKMFCFEYFNLFTRTHTTTLNLSEDIKIGNERSSISIGDNVIGAYSLYDEVQLPNELNSIVQDPLVESKNGFRAALGDILGIYARKPHYLSTIIFRDSRNGWIDKLKDTELKYRRYSFMSSYYVERAKHIQDIIKELQNDYSEDLIVRANTTLLFWENNSTEFLKTKQYFGDIFRKSDILASAPVGKHLKNLFTVSNPFYSGCNSELNVYANTIYTPLSFLPLVSNYKNDDKGFFFCDRFNIPFKMDLWDEAKRHIKARNFMVLAPTGEGKSYFLQELMRQYYEAGISLVIIDLGKSFKKFADILGEDAVFIEFEEGRPFSINPFNRPLEELLSSEKINSLSQFVYAHVDGDIADKDYIFMRKLLKHYISKSRQTLSLRNLITYITEKEEDIKRLFAEELTFTDLSNIKINLSEFIDDGIYSYLYEENVDNKLADSMRNKKVVVFEIDAAKDNPKIINVLLQTIKDTIHTNIWSDKSKKGVILFEEFAKTLKLGNVMSNVEFYYQAIRKQEGAIGIVLQNTSQIPRNDTSESIFDNTQIVFALPNTAGYDSMVDRLRYKDPHSLNLLNSLQNNFSGERKYSEVYIRQGNRERVIRLEVSRRQHLAFITDGEEQQQILKLMNQGLSIKDAIQKL